MLDQRLVSILVCPADRGALVYLPEQGLLAEHPGAALLYNPRLRKAYRIEDGIPVLLVDEAVEVSDEQHQRLMRAAEQSG